MKHLGLGINREKWDEGERGMGSRFVGGESQDLT